MNTNPRPACRRGRALLALLVCSTLSGCWASGTLTGTVSRAGKKVVSGTVAAFGPDNLPHYGKIQPDGSYAIPGLPAGSVRLTVVSPDPRGGAARRPRPGHASIPGKEGKVDLARVVRSPQKPPEEVVKGWLPIPERYGLPETSGLQAEVSRGVTTHDIVLD